MFRSLLIRQSRISSTSWVRRLCNPARSATANVTSHPSDRHPSLNSVLQTHRDLTITWEDGTSATVPYIYLRDNCQEKESYDSHFNQRTFNPAFTVDLHIRPTSVDIDTSGDLMTIGWPDGHKSRFPSAWLAKHCPGRKSCFGRLQDERFYWGSEYLSKMPRFDYPSLMMDDDSLLEFIKKVESHGLVLVENMSKKAHEVVTFMERIAYPRITNYGSSSTLIVGTDAIPTRIGYTNQGLDLHTDLPYYSQPPGFAFLHTIQDLPGPTQGGNLFGDGFYVSEQLKKKNPQAFDLLASQPVLYLDKGKDYLQFNLEYWQPVINLDSQGEITSFQYNNHIRGPEFAASVGDKLFEWYEAWYEISRLLHSPENMFSYKMSAGEMMVFDNHRVLHGRPEFDVNPGEVRHAELAYMNWDEIRSRARVIMDKQNGQTINK